MKRAIVLLLLAAAGLANAEVPEWAVAVFPSGTEFSLEIAADPAKRALGYMYREEVGPTEGMLFLFDADERHSIWMENCVVPLDIIWLDERFRIVEIARNQQPCPADGECPSIVPQKSARYVLEVAGGVSDREGLKPRDRLVILSEPGLP